MAPEVANLRSGESFDAKSADIYSLGITIYVLLVGEFPSPQEINNNFSTFDSDFKSSTDVEMEDESFSKCGSELLTKEVRCLIQSMTHQDPVKRPKIEEVVTNPWLQQGMDDNILTEVYAEMNARKEYMLSCMRKA